MKLTVCLSVCLSDGDSTKLRWQAAQLLGRSVSRRCTKMSFCRPSAASWIINILQQMLRSADCVYLCVCVILTVTAVISLYSFNWLVYVAAARCLLCDVGTDLLGSIPGHSMWYLCCTKWQSGSFLFQSVCSPLSVPFHHCSTLICILYCKVLITSAV